MTAGRHASHGSGRDATGRAARGPAPAFTATPVASCRDARWRRPSGRPAARPVARNRNRSDTRRASRPAPAGTAVSRDCPCGQCSSGNRTRYTPAFAGCSTHELSNGGRPGSRTRARHHARPFAFVCPWRHALPRRIVFGGGAPARLANLHSRASGTSGAFYLARSVPAGVAAHGIIFKSLNRKGNCLRPARGAKRRRRNALAKIRYNRIASYLVG